MILISAGQQSHTHGCCCSVCWGYTPWEEDNACCNNPSWQLIHYKGAQCELVFSGSTTSSTNYPGRALNSDPPTSSPAFYHWTTAASTHSHSFWCSLSMSKKTKPYYYCFMLKCRSTTKASMIKFYINLPKAKKIRRQQ